MSYLMLGFAVMLLLFASLNFVQAFQDRTKRGRLAHGAMLSLQAVFFGGMVGANSGAVNPLSLMEPAIILGICIALAGFGVVLQKEENSGERLNGFLSILLGIALSIGLVGLRIFADFNGGN